MKNQTITVSELNCYPVKSGRGISLTTAVVGEMGIQFDRQWMVVNEHGVFVAQRGDARLGAVGIKTMCLIEPAITSQYLTLSAPGMQTLVLPLEGNKGAERTVRVWENTCSGIDQGDEAALWFTEYLSLEVPGNYRLVRMPDKGTRTTELGGDKVAFADAYPFLLTSEETLQSLNSQMEKALPMNRFRPNIVMKGGEAFTENKIGSFMINDISFVGIKRDGRCPITTIDQMTAISGVEPLRTLGTLMQDGKYVYKEGNMVYFGMYLTHSGTGTISIGDVFKFLG